MSARDWTQAGFNVLAEKDLVRAGIVDRLPLRHVSAIAPHADLTDREVKSGNR